MPEPDCFLRYRIGYGTLQPCYILLKKVSLYIRKTFLTVYVGCQRAALLRGILRRKNPTYMYWWRAARANRGIKMVLVTEPSEDLCRKQASKHLYLLNLVNALYRVPF